VNLWAWGGQASASKGTVALRLNLVDTGVSRRPRAGRTRVIWLSGHRQTHTFPLIQRRGSAAATRKSAPTCFTSARCSTPSFSVRATAQTHFLVPMGLQTLPIIPIVEAKSTLPRLGHAQIVLPAQTVWEGWRAIDGHRTNISHPPGSATHPAMLRRARRADPRPRQVGGTRAGMEARQASPRRGPGYGESRPIVDVKHLHHAGIDLPATPHHPYALVFATFLADAAGNVRGIGAVLEILPASCRQRSIECCRPFIVDLRQSPNLVRAQA
jgi:hypothetical protein